VRKRNCLTDAVHFITFEPVIQVYKLINLYPAWWNYDSGIYHNSPQLRNFLLPYIS